MFCPPSMLLYLRIWKRCMRASLEARPPIPVSRISQRSQKTMVKMFWRQEFELRPEPRKSSFVGLANCAANFSNSGHDLSQDTYQWDGQTEENTPRSPSLGRFASPTISSAVTLLLSEKLSALRCSDVHLFGGVRRRWQRVLEECDDDGPRSMWANAKMYLATKFYLFLTCKERKLLMCASVIVFAWPLIEMLYNPSMGVPPFSAFSPSTFLPSFSGIAIVLPNHLLYTHPS